MAERESITNAKHATKLSAKVPVLTSKEITVVEKFLGEGGYCTVSAVRQIKLLDDDQLSSSTTSDKKADARRNFAKQFGCYERNYFDQQKIMVLALPPPTNPMDTVQRPPKVALKRVKTSLKGKNYQTGVDDLMVEVSILSKCSHPNIISLYAVGCDEEKGRQDESGNENDDENDDDHGNASLPSISFAIIDQLHSTLKNKIYGWREGCGAGIVIQSQRKSHSLWLERMVIILKVADAIHYLHSKGFVHRDLHPGNIGFSDDDVVKLFDFGLAKAVRVGEMEEPIAAATDSTFYDENEMFDLTHCTGTMRYMAPEVALGIQYGFKADIYSFALVMYEVLSLTKPYLRIVQSNNFRNTVHIDGVRPVLDASWPHGVKDTLTKMWSSDSGKRLTSKNVVDVLGGLLRGDDIDLYPIGWIDRLQCRSQTKTLGDITNAI